MSSEQARIPTSAKVLAVLNRLTPRDLTLIDVLGRHQVLTIDQIARMLFNSEQAARARTNVLHQLEVIARFRQAIRPGSQAYRYTLGHLGAYLHAAATDRPVPSPSATTRRISELATHPLLNHLLGSNDFFTRLHHSARTHGDVEVVQWLSEREATALAGGAIRPDGAGALRASDGSEAAFWYEHDRGTQTIQQLARKCDTYGRLPHSYGNRVVLIELTSHEREAHLHTTLAMRTTATVIATSTTPTNPLAPCWRQIGSNVSACDLSALARPCV